MLLPRQQLDLEVARLSVRSQVLKENAEKHEEQMRAMVEAGRLQMLLESWSRRADFLVNCGPGPVQEKNELKRRYDELRTHSERLQEAGRIRIRNRRNSSSSLTSA